MLIKYCRGYELKKEKPNTSEDYFNRSEIIFVENGKERVFRVLYLRYFEEMLHEFTPFQQNPIFHVGNRDVELKDLVALACLIKNPHYRNRKQVYINKGSEFSFCFEGVNFDKLRSFFQELEENKETVLHSSLDYMVESN
ncbi:hypothetical protein JMM81_02395 [Bacillus sp. V3B]|uniref:hypothetical protein n=1 Tax=Bacillus sp. V3B TaxID=2804915 RepID=UPI00210918A0|nr:hypothetical protein [Bacillus sp. V3B]MCQ6273826.1 hypothetical protein [Bacillus sp. V3B]